MNEIKPGDVLKICERHAKEGVGYHDPDTGFSINPQEEKPAPRRISGHLRARVKAGLLINVSAQDRAKKAQADTAKGAAPQAVDEKLKAQPEGVASPGNEAAKPDAATQSQKSGIFDRHKKR